MSMSKQGVVMDRGGEEAIRRMEQEASDQLVKKLGEQMSELFANLAVKQEEENRRLKEENQQMQRQLVEQNNRMEQQSNRMEQMGWGCLLEADGWRAVRQPSECRGDSREGQTRLQW